MTKPRTDAFDPEIQQSLKLFIVLSRASKALMDYAQQDMKHYELNPSEFAVMELLYHKGATPIQQIGSKILLASGTMTYVIDKLVKKGFLQRRPCEKDRRVIYAELTPEGEAVIGDIFPRHAEALHEAVRGMSSQDKEQLIGLLKKLGQNIPSPK